MAKLLHSPLPNCFLFLCVYIPVCILHVTHFPPQGRDGMSLPLPTLIRYVPHHPIPIDYTFLVPLKVEIYANSKNKRFPKLFLACCLLIRRTFYASELCVTKNPHSRPDVRYMPSWLDFFHVYIRLMASCTFHRSCVPWPT